MRKFLPFLVAFSIFFFFFFVPKPVFAEITPVPEEELVPEWQSDSEVTFVGKTASRSGDFLDWALQNYSWICVNKIDANKCNNDGNPLLPFWVIIRNIVYALLALFVLAAAFILVITRGQSLTIMRFIPRFIFIVILITLSFSLVQFIYLVSDIVQGFFLTIDRTNNIFITTQNLLYIGFNYNFTGYRLVGGEGDPNAESAFITLLLVRLTAITYYVMTGILIIRKIILWCFIIISPIFPLLIFYRPIRNTAKIWIGEFFRWLLYAPLFAIFLHGLVVVWKSPKSIPMAFDYSKVGDVVYPTAVNILIGGPGQKIGLSNSVNLKDTFALYVVALLMLWVVILLPFLLLKIFLDYLNTLSIGNSVLFKQLMTKTGLSGPTPPPPATPPSLTMPKGAARALPFLKGAALKPIEIKANVQASVRESADVLALANLSIPRMRDIARYETSIMSNDVSRKNEVNQLHTALNKIANPNTAIVSSDRQKFSTVRQKLLEQKQKGNPIAQSVLSASQVSTATKAEKKVETRQEQISHLSSTLKEINNPGSKVKEKLIAEKEKGNKLAETVLKASEEMSKTDVTEDQKSKMENEILDQLLNTEEKENPIIADLMAKSEAAPSVAASLPAVNKVQQVSLEDYEEVRKLWTENYQTIEPPKDLSGEILDRKQWIKNDIDRINEAITLLTSMEPEKVNRGMSMVANILPFLLIGGFSKTEVVAYLKAKMEAGKSVLEEVKKKEEEEETLVAAGTRKTEMAEAKTAQTSVPLPEEQKNEPKDLEELNKTGQEN